MNTRRILAGLLACAMMSGAGAAFAPGAESSITAQAADNDTYKEYLSDSYNVRNQLLCAEYRRLYTYENNTSVATNAWEFYGFTKTFESDKYQIKSYSILSKVNGEPVTLINDTAFQNCYNLNSVTIPNSVSKIGNFAFSHCTALSEVNIPDSVTYIGYSSFEYCTSLTEVTIPKSVSFIDNYAFMNCSNLSKITVNNSSYYADVDGVLMTADQQTLIQYPAGKPNRSYTVPDSVTTLKYRSIYGNQYLKHITVPSTVTEIKEKAIGYTAAGQLVPNFVIYGIDDGTSDTAAETYAKENSIPFKKIPKALASVGADFCDLNEDEQVNASDAAMVLIASAAVGAGDESAAIPAEKADVSCDQVVNASDAAMILIYSAAVGADFEGNLPQYFAK